MNAYALHKGRVDVQPVWLTAAAPYLDMVEGKIEAAVASDVSAAHDLALHLFSAGGKRIRPAIAILSALASDQAADMDRTVDFATATELVHMASLVHDDVVDETSERRGAPTANMVWGNKISVLGGDFLLSKAFQLLARDSDREVMQVLSAAAVKMTEGELLQASSEGNLTAWETNYWSIIEGKTAAFMSACCECGAVIAGAQPHIRAALAEYGLQIGYAFQITDDLLDITGDPSVTGKETGTDLMHGKFTLPVLLACEDFDPEERRLLVESGKTGISREKALEVTSRVIAVGAVERARNLANECAGKAVAQLAGLLDSEFKAGLEGLAGSLTGRKV